MRLSCAALLTISLIACGEEDDGWVDRVIEAGQLDREVAYRAEQLRDIARDHLPLGSPGTIELNAQLWPIISASFDPATMLVDFRAAVASGHRPSGAEVVLAALEAPEARAMLDKEWQAIERAESEFSAFSYSTLPEHRRDLVGELARALHLDERRIEFFGVVCPGIREAMAPVHPQVLEISLHICDPQMSAGPEFTLRWVAYQFSLLDDGELMMQVETTEGAHFREYSTAIHRAHLAAVRMGLARLRAGISELSTTS